MEKPGEPSRPVEDRFNRIISQREKDVVKRKKRGLRPEKSGGDPLFFGKHLCFPFCGKGTYGKLFFLLALKKPANPYEY